MKKWSRNWKASRQPRKQRKYRFQAPLHIKIKSIASHLSKELRKKYGRRSLGVRTEDKVKILVGNFKGKEGKISNVNVKRGKVYVEGIEHLRKDGSKARVPLDASNLMILALGKEDKRVKKQTKEKKNEKKQTTEGKKG